MTTPPDQVFSDFVDAWNAGRRPDVAAYLDRVAPEHRAALAADIGRFAAVAPEPAYAPEALAALRSEAAGLVALPSLLSRARERAQVSLRDLARALGVSDEGKAVSYLEQLESGALDPAGVSRRVFDSLGRALGLTSGALEAAADRFTIAPVRAAAAPAMWRADPAAAAGQREDLERLAQAMAAPEPEPWDEVDELFRGGR